MIPFERPLPPEGFNEKSKEHLEALGDPKPKSEGWPKFKDSFWQKLKPHFVRAQHDKCGYCEVSISGHGDVEHYRPKKGIQKLMAERNEFPDSKRIDSKTAGKVRPQITEHGYWWLAYDWENYLLSCDICNQSYKNALFPVAHPRATRMDSEFNVQNPKQNDIHREKPLLINPYEKDFDPCNYFEFTVEGFIKPRKKGPDQQVDPRALATIKVCGLHRTSLVRKRARRAMKIRAKSLDLLKTVLTPDKSEQESLATDIFFEGHEISPFAGMVRVIFTQTTTLEWSELERLLVKNGWMQTVDTWVQNVLQVQNNRSINGS
ncbi:HNH endonuclease family protein [Spongiimicrobium salis]|uniref:hypothetical protein n=1 Tax=Spongiimicrobium salis TaxID=1667022 RepID=UPI00374C9EAD